LIGGFGNIPAPVREPREEGGNHRTEVTEATEEEFGGWWLVGGGALETFWVPCENHAKRGKSSHRGHRGHGGGIGVDGVSHIL
jgi:hypothetical protein